MAPAAIQAWPWSSIVADGKPVVTSNSGSMWKMMRLVGDKSVVPGGGRLFREH